MFDYSSNRGSIPRYLATQSSGDVEESRTTYSALISLAMATSALERKEKNMRSV